MRVDDAEHRVGDQRRVDRIAALPQHLSAGLAGQEVRGGDDAAGHIGTIKVSACGITSKIAGTVPGSSPSTSSGTGNSDSTSTRLAR